MHVFLGRVSVALQAVLAPVRAMAEKASTVAIPPQKALMAAPQMQRFKKDDDHSSDDEKEIMEAWKMMNEKAEAGKAEGSGCENTSGAVAMGTGSKESKAATTTVAPVPKQGCVIKPPSAGEMKPPLKIPDKEPDTVREPMGIRKLEIVHCTKAPETSGPDLTTCFCLTKDFFERVLGGVRDTSTPPKCPVCSRDLNMFKVTFNCLKEEFYELEWTANIHGEKWCFVRMSNEHMLIHKMMWGYMEQGEDPSYEPWVKRFRALPPEHPDVHKVVGRSEVRKAM